MPTFAALTLNDGVADRTYNPQGSSYGIARLLDRVSNDTSSGFSEVTLSFDRANSQRSTDKVKINFAFPVEHVVDGMTRVAFIARANLDVILPSEMTDSHRQVFYNLMKNLIGSGVVEDYVQELDPYWT